MISTRPWRWVLLAAAFAFVYEALAATVAARLPDLNPASLDLPIRIVQGSHAAWRVLILLWPLAAALGACCLRLSKSDWTGWSIGRFIAVQALVLAALLCVTVTFSGDAYAYVIYGRLYGVHGLDPYALGSTLAVTDDSTLGRLFAFFGNPPPGDNYGPLWTLIAGAVGRLESATPLAAQVWTYRIIAAVSAIAAVGGVLWSLRRQPIAERLRQTSLFAFHPLVLYESAVGAHNDVMMIAAAVWAFALVDELPLFAGLLLGASIALKYVSIVIAPFVVIRAFRISPANGLLCALVAFSVPVLLFQPFWAGWETLASLIGHTGTLGMSPLWLASLPFFASGNANVPVFGAASWPRVFELVALLAAIVVVAFAAFRYNRTFDRRYVWQSIVAAVMSLPLVHPWYVQWLLPATAFGGRWATYAWWAGMLIFARYALEGVAAATAGQFLTPLLVALTLTYLVVPVLLASRDAAATNPSR